MVPPTAAVAPTAESEVGSPARSSESNMGTFHVFAVGFLSSMLGIQVSKWCERKQQVSADYASLVEV